MIGGDREQFERLLPVFRTLAPSEDRGYVHTGPSGSGHFVKMVHNGIEYGLMQAYAEGFELMRAKSEFDLDLAEMAETWRSGSVVRSWLLDLTAEALRQDPALEGIQAYVEDSGEGRWAVEESVELAVPVPVIAMALQARFRSRQNQPSAHVCSRRCGTGSAATRSDPRARWRMGHDGHDPAHGRRYSESCLTGTGPADRT